MKLVRGGARPGRASRAGPLSLEAKVLLASVGGLCLLGLPIVLSASAPGSILSGGSPWSYVTRQCMYMAIGVAVAVVASRTPPELVRRSRLVALFAGLALLVAVFVPGVGHYAGGSSRWIGIGPIQVQPSELMKLAMVVFAADLLARRADRRDQWNAMVRPLLVVMGLAAVLIVKQPDLGTAVVLGCLTFSMLFAAGVRLPLLGVSAISVCGIGAVLAMSATYRRDRLLSFVNPFAHASTTGYQVVQSLATLGLGGLTGNGVGGSATSWGFLPNAHTDFVFAIIAGNLGLVGALAVIAGFAAFGWSGFRIAASRTGPVRPLSRRRDHVLGPGAGGDKHRRRHRRAPRHRHPAPVHLLRRVLARRRAARRGSPVRDRPAPACGLAGTAGARKGTGFGLHLGAPRRERTRTPAPVGRRPWVRMARVTTRSRFGSPSVFALVTGGGTAGHVQPALAVSEALVARGHPQATIRYVGSRRGIEGRLVPEAGFAASLLPGRGLQRRLTLENVGAIGGLLVAWVLALAIVLRRRPR